MATSLARQSMPYTSLYLSDDEDEWLDDFAENSTDTKNGFVRKLIRGYRDGDIQLSPEVEA